jgi:peptide-methionine (S)-S-oxide reductase
VTDPQHATLGGGCFWCLDAVYRQLDGVTQLESGYAGGQTPDPTYEAVCSGRTGHAEVVQVHYDPDRISYRDLLDVFFSIHDPTTKDRQGADVGTQYRSVIFTHDEAQAEAARAVIAELDQADLFADPIVTQVEPMGRFWPAEPYHQDYFAQNPGQGYCRVVVAPKVAKFRAKWQERLRA